MTGAPMTRQIDPSQPTSAATARQARTDSHGTNRRTATPGAGWGLTASHPMPIGTSARKLTVMTANVETMSHSAAPSIRRRTVTP